MKSAESVRYQRDSPHGDKLSRNAFCAALCALALATTGSAEAPPGSSALAARLAADESASEHWDLTASFTSGHALFVRTMITNAGPGSNMAVVIGHVIFPDGRVFDFDNGRTEGDWRAAQDGLFLKIGGSKLNLREPERSFAKQSKKRGIQLEASFGARPVFEMAGDKEPGIAATALAPVESTFQVRGMDAPVHVEGVAMLRHAWSRESERGHTRRWIDVIAGSDDDGVVLWGFETPTGEKRQWLSRTRDGVPAFETSEFTWMGDGVSGSEPGYPVPRSVALKGAGVSGRLVFADELLRVDPMAIIPQPFRWFLSQQSAPRRILSRARLELDPLAGQPGFEGAALVGSTWTNPLP